MSIRVMDIPVIHVHTQSDKHTQPYTVFMWETMRSLANYPELLRLSVHCMGPTATEKLATLPATKTYHVPNISSDHGLVGSVGHGACVEHALSFTDDGDIHIIVDSDTVVLAKGWDDYVRHMLLDKDVGTFGTTYEDIGGFTSGAGDVQTYKGAPNVVWMALSPLHRWQDMRALPEKGTNLIIENEGMSKIYGLPVGNHVLRDVAWQIPEYLASRSISYIGWKQLKPSSPASIVLKGLSDYHEEYHVSGDVPFVVHHRGSMKHKYRIDDISVNFYKAVDAWLNEETRRQPRWRWVFDDKAIKTAAQLSLIKTQSAERIKAIEATAGRLITSGPNVGLPIPPVAIEALARDAERAKVVTEAPPVARGETLSGWAKVTLGNNVVLPRHARVPQAVDVTYVPTDAIQTIRVEGNVMAGLQVVVPPPVDNTSHKIIVRNVTPGTVTVMSTYEGRRSISSNVPSGACWMLLVDVDGVIHVS